MVVPIQLDTDDWQDVRIAVVMNGGVSLAIWISGVTLELEHLVAASRFAFDRATAAQSPAGRLPQGASAAGSSAEPPEGSAYGELLNLLQATARVDVIAGTSAGGINGGFLALGLVHGRDLATMGKLWEDKGGLISLLRSPTEKDPPSLLCGDDYFLPTVEAAYREIYHARPLGGVGGPYPPEKVPVELYMTTTLMTGKQSTFTDDQGTPITETDYAATFAFSNRDPATDGLKDGNLADASVLAQLAVASRCTSCFPGAFEPHWVIVDGKRPVDGRWPSDGGLASFPNSQFVIDGGVLLNKPIRPALEAIYRQPAERQVRRILAYVVPDPSSSAHNDPPSNSTPDVPHVLLAVNTRLRSADSVSRELEEIRTRNARVRERRAARIQIVNAITDDSARLASRCWESYRRVRARISGRSIGELVSAARPDWSTAEIADAFIRRAPLPFVPQDETLAAALDRSGADWTWGITTAERLGTIAIDILKRALWLTPVDEAHQDRRQHIRAARAKAHAQLLALRELRERVDSYWRHCPAPDAEAPIAVPTGLDHASRRRAQLDAWVAARLREWSANPPASAQQLWDHVLELARILADATEHLRAASQERNDLLDPGGDEAERLAALVGALLRTPDPPVQVLRRMLELDVLQLAFAGATDDVEQEVELVEISAATKDRDGRPANLAGKLTGVQVYHFGAFYRRSWRVNDWLQGRMDGIARLVEILLSPERLRQLGYRSRDALDAIEAIALGPESSPDRDYLARQWEDTSCAQELAFLDRPANDHDRLPSTLPACARNVARRLQTEVLHTELKRLANAIVIEQESERPVPDGSETWLAEWREAVAGHPQGLSAGAVWHLFRRIDLISSQRIVNDSGSDFFARTTSRTAAVLASTLAAPRVPAIGGALKAIRGYALVLWAMVHLATGQSRIGPNLVNLLVTTGAAIVALALLAPGIPPAVAVLGAATMLAGATTALLRTPANELTRRVLPPVVVAILAVIVAVVLVYRGSIKVETHVVFDVALVLAIILFGRWIGGVR